LHCALYACTRSHVWTYNCRACRTCRHGSYGTHGAGQCSPYLIRVRAAVTCELVLLVGAVCAKEDVCIAGVAGRHPVGHDVALVVQLAQVAIDVRLRTHEHKCCSQCTLRCQKGSCVVA
jgi:hypothetical protein